MNYAADLLTTTKGAMPNTERRALRQLASYGNKDGTSCYPGVPRLARDLLISERHVQRSLAWLVTNEWIVRTGKLSHRYGPYIYAINLAKLRAAGPATRTYQTPVRGDIFAKQGVTFSAPRGDIFSNQGVTKVVNPPDPLYGIPKELKPKKPTQQKRAGLENTSCEHDASVAWVLKECGGATGRWERAAISAQLRLVVDSGPDPASTVAKRMVAVWREYQALGKLGYLKFSYGLRNFFDGGHWKNPDGWLLDHKKIASVAEARVGSPSPVPDIPASPPIPPKPTPWPLPPNDAEDEPEDLPQAADRAAGLARWLSLAARLESRLPKKNFDLTVKPLRVRGLAGGVLYMRGPNRDFAELESLPWVRDLAAAQGITRFEIFAPKGAGTCEN